ncbi:MAG: undecaprenyl-diphosphate phosphatase [Candidatus Pacearchaeota archaeon]
MVSITQGVILGILQGITEWLPISSTGHLAIAEEIFGLKEFSFAVFLHIASILAVIFIFYRDILNILDFRKKDSLKYIGLIIIALIPAALAGFFLENKIRFMFSNIFFVGIFFIISGFIIFSTKFFKEKKDNVDLKSSLFIGIFQIFGLFPGISRSGSTISGGIFCGLKRSEVMKFSFILAIPIIFGAFLLESRKIVLSEISWIILIISFIVTFLTSLFSIKILLKLVKGNKFYFFGFYNLIIGIFVLIWSFLK